MSRTEAIVKNMGGDRLSLADHRELRLARSSLYVAGMKKTMYLGLLSLVSIGFAATSARAESTISFIEAVHVTAKVRAGKWSKRDDQNNRIRFEVTAKPVGQDPNRPYEFLMFFSMEQDRLKNGDWASSIPFSVAPSHLDRLDLRLTVKKFGFKGKYVGFDWFDIIPYAVESATARYPLEDVRVNVTREVSERILRGEPIDLKKSYADGSELVVRLSSAPTKQVTLTELKNRYESDCHRYGDHMRGGSPLGSAESVYGFKERLAHIRAVIAENESGWSATDCTDRKHLR